MAQDPQGYGRVLSLGEDLADKRVKDGDILVFHTRAGMDMVHGKKVLKCLKYEEVYGVLDDPDLAGRLETLDFGGKTEGSTIVSPRREGIVIAS